MFDLRYELADEQFDDCATTLRPHHDQQISATRAGECHQITYARITWVRADVVCATMRCGFFKTAAYRSGLSSRYTRRDKSEITLQNDSTSQYWFQNNFPLESP